MKRPCSVAIAAFSVTALSACTSRRENVPDAASAADLSVPPDLNSSVPSDFAEPPSDVGSADAASLGQLGAQCSHDSDCDQLACIDGVCCERSCGGCSACNLPDSRGRCTPIDDGSDPHHACWWPCHAGCVAGACALKPTGAACGSYCADERGGAYHTISSTVRTGSCASDGSCGAYHDASCGLFRCRSDSACATSCAYDVDCVWRAFCGDAGACVAKLDLNATCRRDTQCGSLRCIGDRCVECASSRDCRDNPNGAVCQNGACSSCQNNDALCVSAGMGSFCGGNECRCQGPAECHSGQTPYCGLKGSRWEYQCICGSTSPVCDHDQVCSARDGGGHCVTNGAFPCRNTGECLSGSCRQGFCALNHGGQNCVRNQDCASNLCSSDGICQ